VTFSSIHFADSVNIDLVLPEFTLRIIILENFNLFFSNPASLLSLHTFLSPPLERARMHALHYGDVVHKVQMIISVKGERLQKDIVAFA